MESGLQSAFFQLIKPAFPKGSAGFFVAAVCNRHAHF
jgi:hypothetical protein